MKIKLAFVLMMSLVSFSAFAQDQVAVDWAGFWQKYDINHDQKLSQDEFEKVEDFAPFSYANTFQGHEQHHKIFKQLDQNKDSYIDVNEFAQIESVVESPLMGRVWHSDIATHF
ncbi:EF-hand domain-containing protein [Acinetobacter gerneri]|uniref:EF-hand domain-containing protein n=1 Tax=Acinetobacter gerneri TaxID=202952 RepID=UPI003213DD62